MPETVRDQMADKAKAEARRIYDDPARRMDAYYYGFEPTGVQAIDAVLSAVATAGKMFHGTDCWNDEMYGYPSAREVIQATADLAAEALSPRKGGSDEG